MTDDQPQPEGLDFQYAPGLAEQIQAANRTHLEDHAAFRDRQRAVSTLASALAVAVFVLTLQAAWVIPYLVLR